MNRTLRVVFGLCVLVGLTVGCNNNSLTSTPPDIAASPGELVFVGSQFSGSGASLTLIISNDGGGALNISSIDFGASTSAEFSWEFASGGLTEIPVLGTGDFFAIAVVFTPDDPAAETGELIIQSNDPDENPLIIPIVTQAVGPSIECAPNPVTFLTAPNTTVNRTVTCTNTGTQPLNVSGFTVDPSTSADFAPQLPATPIVLDLAEQFAFQVAYTPGELGTDAGAIDVHSDAIDGDYRIELAGEGTDAPLCLIQAVPFWLDWGKTFIGNGVNKTLFLNNDGEAMCNVSMVEIQALTNEFVYAGATSFQISPGGTQILTVGYQPSDRIPDFGSLVVTSDDPNGQTSVLLTGSGVAPEIDVFPCPADFGLVTVGCKLDKELTIYNTGDVDLTISNTSISGGNGYFSVLTPPPGTLAPGGSGTMEVRFEPAAAGAQTAMLTITNNDPDEGNFVCTLEGEGTNEDHQVDEFNTDTPMADLLFVVDNSGSMSDEQQLLADSFSDFYDFIAAENVSFHLGVTTTDIDGNPVMPGAQGKLVGNPKIIDNSTANAKQKFAQNVNVGDNGDATERGLEAARLAITEPLVSTDNAGFLRPNAKLFMIFVSDEEDQSPLPDQLQPPSYYEQAFLNAKNNAPEMVSASAIDGQPGDSCAQEGARYNEVVDALGGVKSTICTNNFSMALEQLAFEITAPIDTFFLTRDPIPATIMVYIDNVLQSAATWSYNAGSNSVKITPPPTEGSTVRIEYDVVCEMS